MMLVGGIVVDKTVDFLSRRCLYLDGLDEADELPVPMAPHIAVDDAPVDDFEGANSIVVP